MNQLITNPSKTLKLTNVLKYKCPLQEEEFNFHASIEQMQSYIKTKGAMQVGPLIQYTRPYVSEAGELNIEMVVLLQCNHLIHKVEPPYQMEAVLRVPDCMYCRYIGSEHTLKYAYDKLGVEAFEQEIALEGSSYTVFVDSDEEEERMTADVFMPRKED